MKQYNTREFRKLLEDNGFEYLRCNGDHFIYERSGVTVVVNRKINMMVAKRLIKENNLL